jgi:hypothetical protein
MLTSNFHLSPRLRNFILTFLVTFFLLIGFSQPVKANLADWTGLEHFRRFMSGRVFVQYFIADRPESDLARMKEKHGPDGGDNKMSDWCYDTIQGQLNEFFERKGMKYLTTRAFANFPTWRVENGKVNCYARNWRILE